MMEGVPSRIAIRDRYRQAIAAVLGASSAVAAAAWVTSENDVASQAMVLVVFGGCAAWMLRIATTVVRAEGDTLLIRNPWRTYRFRREEIRGISVGETGYDQLTSASGLRGTRPLDAGTLLRTLVSNPCGNGCTRRCG
jgi:hypothetical protein